MSYNNHPKCVRRSIKIAYDLFPSIYPERDGYRTYHFAFTWRKNKLEAVGVNSYKPHPKIKSFGYKFNNPKQIKYSRVHAEMSALSKMLGKSKIDDSITMVSLRINKNLKLMNSRPCKECLSVIRGFDIKKTYYSTKYSTIEMLN